MKASDRIKQAKIDILRHKKFCAFSGVVAAGTTTITTDIPTACTDGLNTMYNPQFVESLTQPQLRLLVLHEATHAAYRHLHTWRSLWEQDRKLTNIAADHFVNLSLIDTDAGEGFIAMPDVGIQPEPKYRGWSVQQIFDDLKANPPEGGSGGSSGEPQGGDDPDSPDGDGGFDQHDWQSAGAQSAEAQAAQAREIDQALRQGEMLARKRGMGSGPSSELMADLLTPKHNWKEQLRDFVQQVCQGRDESTWRKPNRRYLADDVYLPSSEAVSMGPLVVGFDTSGSCFSGTVISRFVTELTAIVEAVAPSKLYVVYWDWDVRAHQVFEDGQFALSNIRPQGGGGTNGAVLFDWLREQQIKPEAVVQFTDGYVGDWGSCDVPTLWAITERGVTAPWGTSIHVSV